MSEEEKESIAVIGQPFINFFRYDEYLRMMELSQGVLRLDETIREMSTARLLAEIRHVQRLQLPKLTLHISSGGGGAYYAFAIYDALRNLAEQGEGVKITCLVGGWAASAAAMIVLQAADEGERLAYGHARFLLHEARRWVFFCVERTSDLQDEVREMEALSAQIVKVLAARCGKAPSEVENLISRKEVWFSANEALEWGLIDRIV